jgi:hypothetical protein
VSNQGPGSDCHINFRERTLRVIRGFGTPPGDYHGSLLARQSSHSGVDRQDPTEAIERRISDFDPIQLSGIGQGRETGQQVVGVF